MNVTIHSDPVPLRVDEHGVIRVGGSRLSLDVVLDYHQQGMPAEEIADGYRDIISLADVLAVLAYYHRHREEIDAYLERRGEEFDQIHRQIEEEDPRRAEFRQRILARQTTPGNGNAAPGH